MRRWMATPLVLAAAIMLASLEAPPVFAQKEKDKDKDNKDGPVAQQLYTADGMELYGLFHATKKAKNVKDAPVVVFLYPPGPDRDMTKGDWGGLASRLNEEGYHVFQFDWRGHGKSTTIKDRERFWKNAFLNGNGNFNSYIRGKQGVKNTLEYKDIGNPTRYMPAYLNDLAAVRLFLDTKNDKGDLNSSSIYLVGSGDAAALGMAWITAEWKRQADMPNDNQLGFMVGGYDFIPQDLNGGVRTEAGNDFAGCVWLTPSRPSSFPGSTMQKWVSTVSPKIRETNPMLFLYGEKDRTGKEAAVFYYQQVLVSEPPKNSPLSRLTQTFLQDVKGAEQLQGLKLLGQDGTLKTETTIAQFFSAIKKARANLPWKNRDYKNPYYVNLKYFGLNP